MADNDSRIAELLARWQAEPGSRVFVQLAEEYRRGGKLNEALKVLEAGLKRQPNYLSAKIALGRCRLETGEVAVAADIFQEVLRRDATNLVANKLLVQAYLDAGNLGKAREQLNLYRILNDRDPDIEDLKQQIEGGGKPKARKQEAVEPEMVEEDSSPFLEPVLPEPEIEAEGESGSRAPGVSPPEDAAPPVPEPEMEAAPEAATPMAATTEEDPVPVAPAAADGDVFGALFQAEDQQRYMQGLGAEGLFGDAGVEPPPETEAKPSPAVIEGTPEPSAIVAEPEPVFESVEAAEPPAAPAPVEPPASAAPGDDLFGGIGAGAPLAGVAEDDEDPVFHLPPVAPGTTSVRAPEADAHSMAEGEPEAPEGVSEAVAADVRRRVEDAAATMMMPPVSPEILGGEVPGAGGARGAGEAPGIDEEPPATATLGQLYLQQGHREEARKIFRRVLDREPTHPVALAALQAMDQKPEAPPPAPAAPAAPTAPAASTTRSSGTGAVVAEGPGWLSAGDLLGADELATVQGLTARKALLLKNYLHRLRAGGQEA
jgi:tetratricopeptide (TPR) repeat protein